MNGPEKAFWDKLRKKSEGIHWQRIESPYTSQGIPDLNGCRAGVERWVELKAITRGNQVGLRPEQVVWHYKRQMAGATTWIMARVTKQGSDYICLWRGDRVMEVADLGMKKCEPCWMGEWNLLPLALDVIFS